MRLRPGLFRAGGDPGPSWAREALDPLRRLEADCDVVPVVMARLRALHPAVAAVVSPLLPSSRLAWRWSVVLGGATLVSLAATLAVLILSGDEGSREALRATASLGRLLLFVIELAVSLVIRIAAAGVPLLRGLLAIVQAASPVLLGAATLAAACGVLSIVYSSYVFAHARRAAPPARAHGGTR